MSRRKVRWWHAHSPDTSQMKFCKANLWCSKCAACSRVSLLRLKREFKSHKLNNRFSFERAWNFTIEEISPHTHHPTLHLDINRRLSYCFLTRSLMLRSFDSENDWLVERFYDFSSIGQSINSCYISYDRAARASIRYSLTFLVALITTA